MAMFGYMTDLETVEAQKTEEIVAEGQCKWLAIVCFLYSFYICVSSFVPRLLVGGAHREPEYETNVVPVDSEYRSWNNLMTRFH